MKTDEILVKNIENITKERNESVIKQDELIEKNINKMLDVVLRIKENVKDEKNKYDDFEFECLNININRWLGAFSLRMDNETTEKNSDEILKLLDKITDKIKIGKVDFIRFNGDIFNNKDNFIYLTN